MNNLEHNSFSVANAISRIRKDFAALNIMREGIFIVDADMKNEMLNFQISFVNAQLAHWFSKTPDDFIAQPLEYCFPKIDYHALHDAVAESYLFKKTVTLEIDLKTINWKNDTRITKACLRLTPRTSKQQQDMHAQTHHTQDKLAQKHGEKLNTPLPPETAHIPEVASEFEQIIGTIDNTPQFWGKNILSAPALSYASANNMPHKNQDQSASFQNKALKQDTRNYFDAITGLPIRAYFLEKAAAEFRRSQRYNHKFSIATIFLKNIPQIRKEHGQEGAYQAVDVLAHICEASCRSGIDCIGHISSFELALLLPETPLAKAMLFLKRLNEKIASTPVAINGKTIQLETVMGVDALQNDDASVHRILKRAQASMKF